MATSVSKFTRAVYAVDWDAQVLPPRFLPPARLPRRAATAATLLALALAATSEAAPPPAPAAAAPPAPAPLVVRVRECMSTACRISIQTDDAPRAEAAADRAFAEMDRLEALMTSWRPDSTVSRINRAAGNGKAIPVDPDTFAVIKRSLEVAALTGGAFDITFAAFRGVWKFDQDNDGSLPDPALVKQRLALVNYKDLIVNAKRRTARLRRKDQRIDLGGIAKGYIVDAAVKVLRAQGYKSFMVQAGGDFFAAGRRGDRDWVVGIQDPRGPHPCPPQAAGGCIFATLRLHDAAFSTSGDYERFVMKDGKRYHHIIDPKTGYPATAARSMTILAPDAFTADALDTAMLILGPEKGMQIVEDTPGVEGVMVDAKNQVHVSSGLRGRLENLRTPTDGP